jgi:AhpD family alkylhydroperoxidase
VAFTDKATFRLSSPSSIQIYVLGTAGRLRPTRGLLSHLVDIRASQMNGCAFCLDMHVKEAKLHGERELRLYHVAIWRESPLFTPKERAALVLTEALTQIAPTGISACLSGRRAANACFQEIDVAVTSGRNWPVDDHHSAGSARYAWVFMTKYKVLYSIGYSVID